MKFRAALLWLPALLAGCAAGPHYRPPAEPVATLPVRITVTPDSTRTYFDSLATAARADTAGLPVFPALPPLALTPASMADLNWRDVLRDSTLTRLVTIALSRNRDLEQARARIREYRAEVRVARAPLLPDLSLLGSVSRNKITLGTTLVPPYTAMDAEATVSWELDVFGGARRGLEAAQADRASQEDLEQATVLSLISQVADGYLQLLELDQERDIANQTVASRKVTLGLARRRFAQGVISELDVRQFEAEVAVAASRLAQVEQLRAEQEHGLDVLMGAGAISIPGGGSLAAMARTVTVPDSVSGSLLLRRPDVQASERAFAAATARIGVADAARLPSFVVSAAYGSQSPNSEGLFKKRAEIYEFFGGISIPIFAGGRLQGEVQAARARADEARDQYEQTLLAAVGEAGDALAGVRTSRENAAALDLQVTALRRALDLAELRYRTGVSNYLDVLDSERSLFDAQLEASQAELSQLTSVVQLYKALGGGWPAACGDPTGR